MVFGDDSNEGYPDGEEPLHFYYNREERLSHAPKIVRDYYDGKGPHITKGLFRSLVSTRANRLMLIAVGFCLVLILFMSVFGDKPDRGTIAGIPVQLTAFSYDDAVYVSIRLQDGEGEKNVSVDTLFSAVNKNDQVSEKRKLTVIYAGKETFVRTKFSDYDIIEITAEVMVGNETKLLKTAVEKR